MPYLKYSFKEPLPGFEETVAWSPAGQFSVPGLCVRCLAHEFYVLKVVVVQSMSMWYVVLVSVPTLSSPVLYFAHEDPFPFDHGPDCPFAKLTGDAKRCVRSCATWRCQLWVLLQPSLSEKTVCKKSNCAHWFNCGQHGEPLFGYAMLCILSTKIEEDHEMKRC